MPRPISWLPQLHLIRRSVGSSVRSHYERRDLELLFQLQPSAAAKLLGLLPTVAIGTSKLVPRDALARFLEAVQASDDVPALLERMSLERRAAARRRRKYLVAPVEPGGMRALPDSITIEPGRLEVRFGSVREMCEALYALVQVAECEEFERLYSPERPAEREDPGREVREMFAELRRLEEAARMLPGEREAAGRGR